MTAAAQIGDAAFATVVEQHRSALLAHCYRMTGSLHDAEDAVQETLIRAWRSFDSFEGRSSVRTWLFTIATNASLRITEQRRRRVLPIDYGPAWDPHGPVSGSVEENVWITPFPSGAPATAYEHKESVELAFVAALQVLPGRQRAVLLLRDVLGLSAAETAEAVGSTVASVNSALNRARRTIESRADENPSAAPDDPETRAVVERFVDAWVRHDIEALVALLADDVEMTMPPMPMWFRGVDDVTTFLRTHPLSGQLQWRASELSANERPGFALYEASGTDWVAHSLNLLTVRDGRISRFDAFLTPDLFDAFDLVPPADKAAQPTQHTPRVGNSGRDEP